MIVPCAPTATARPPRPNEIAWIRPAAPIGRSVLPPSAVRSRPPASVVARQTGALAQRIETMIDCVPLLRVVQVLPASVVRRTVDASPTA
jgi:hypothetical protein